MSSGSALSENPPLLFVELLVCQSAEVSQVDELPELVKVIADTPRWAADQARANDLFRE
jgi:hypothetical protein